jgi:hypothetical protein
VEAGGSGGEGQPGPHGGDYESDICLVALDFLSERSVAVLSHTLIVVSNPIFSLTSYNVIFRHTYFQILSF